MGGPHLTARRVLPNIGGVKSGAKTELIMAVMKKKAPKSRAIGLKCPTCGELAAPPASAGRKSPRPFCSTRCAEVDLGKWFEEQYAIPTFDVVDDTVVEAMVAGAEDFAGRQNK